MNPGSNPYIAGAPLRGEKGFFGRQDILEWVSRELKNPQTNALVLFGQRRIGKTTLLLQLARTLPPKQFLPIYFDLQDQATRPLGQALADLADSICEKVGIEFPAAENFDDQGRYFQREFLPQIYQLIGDARRPVFLLDEFDVLDRSAEAELDESATAKALFPLLRRLMTVDPLPAFVFVVGRRAEDLSLDFNATFKASLVREVWVLDPSSAEALVRQAEVNGTLEFTPAAVERALSLTDRHPYLTQLICQRIWENAYAENPSKTPVIDQAQVDAAVASALEAGNQALDWLWSGLNPAEKIYAAALAEIAAENEPIPEDHITRVLAEHASRLRTREVELAPRDLVKRHVLEARDDHSYAFAIELFRRWVRQNKPLHIVKDEIDRLDPIADRLFGIGIGFFNRRQWDQAIRYFQDALNLNPRHFRARLYLGESLLELGRVDEALVALDQAFDLDQVEARLPLARARISRGLALEQAGDEAAALAMYESVLAISPLEVQAKDRVAAIWRQRGRTAEQKENLTAALDAYRKAGYQEGILRIEKTLLLQTLSDLETQAREHARHHRWLEAAAAYEQLVQEAPDEQSRQRWVKELEEARARALEALISQAQDYEKAGEWAMAAEVYRRMVEEEELEQYREDLERVHQAAQLAGLFEQGVQAMHNEDWKTAQKFFVELVQQRPDYTHNGLLAAALLLDSVQRRRRRLTINENWRAIQARARAITRRRVKAPIPSATIESVPLREESIQTVKETRRERFMRQPWWKKVGLVLLGLLALLLVADAGTQIYDYYQPPRYSSNPILTLPDTTTTEGTTNQITLLEGWDTPDGIYALALDQDSTRLVSVHNEPYSGTAYKYYAVVWDLNRGELLYYLKGHREEITSVDYAPDGSLITTGSADKTIRLWRASDGHLEQTLKGHTYDVLTVAFSPDGSQLASGSADGEIWIWQASDGSPVRILREIPGWVTSLDYSPDGKLLAYAVDDFGIRLWDMDKRSFTWLSGHNGVIKSMAFSPDGGLLASAGEDRTIRIWQVSDGSPLLVLEGHGESVNRVSFSPDGALLASASSDGSVRLWSAKDGSPLRKLMLSTDPITDIEFSANGEFIVAGDEYSHFYSNLAEIHFMGVVGDPPVLTLDGHTAPVTSVDIAPQGTLIASGAEDESVRLWSLLGGEEVKALVGHQASVTSLDFSPDGTTLASGSADNTIRLWDTLGGRQIGMMEGHGDYIRSVAFSPDGELLASGSEDNTIRLWRVSDGELLQTLEGHSGTVHSVDFSPDGDLLASGSDDNTVRIWQVSEGSLLLVLEGHSGGVKSVAYSPNGDWLASGSDDQSIRLWQVSDGSLVNTLEGHTDYVNSLAFSPKGEWLASGSDDQTIRLWQTGDGELIRTIRTQGGVNSLTFSPNGSLMLAGLSDKTVRLWESGVSPLETISGTGFDACLVTDTSGIGDPFNATAWAGVEAAMEDFGVEGYILESSQEADYIANIQTFVDDGCRLIITVGFNLFEATQIAAEANPERSFTIVDMVDEPSLGNILGQYYQVDQAAFLAGYLAAGMSESGVVGTFGGVQAPPVTQFMDGFVLGVRKYNEQHGASVEVLGWDPDTQSGLFSNSFVDIDLGFTLGSDLIAQDADVLFPVAGLITGRGAAQAALEAGDTYLIGVDSDWFHAAPEFGDILLTSVVKRSDITTRDAILASLLGTFRGGLTIGDLANQGVDLAPYHNLEGAIPDDLKSSIEDLRAEIIKGEIQTRME